MVRRVTARTNPRPHNLALAARRRTPAVRRTRELLRTTIVQRHLPGDMLPSEWELMTHFGVSRGVIREALDLLRGEGLIDRLQGAGTFVVARERQVIQIEHLGAILRHIDDGDARVRWELLVHETVPAPQLVAERLEVPEGAPVIHAERRQTLDGEPVMLRSSWLPCGIGEILASEPTASRCPLDDLVERALGHPVEHADLRIEATLVDEATSSVLAVEPGSPLLLWERLMYDVLGRPVEYGHVRIRGDRFALTTHMRRRGGCDFHGRWRGRNSLAVTPSRSRRTVAPVLDVVPR